MLYNYYIHNTKDVEIEYKFNKKRKKEEDNINV